MNEDQKNLFSLNLCDRLGVWETFCCFFCCFYAGGHKIYPSVCSVPRSHPFYELFQLNLCSIHKASPDFSPLYCEKVILFGHGEHGNIFTTLTGNRRAPLIFHMLLLLWHQPFLKISKTFPWFHCVELHFEIDYEDFGLANQEDYLRWHEKCSIFFSWSYWIMYA